MAEIPPREGKRKLDEESVVEEIPPREGKRKLEEESVVEEGDGVEDLSQIFATFIGEDGEEYYVTDDDDIRYDDGRKMSIRHQKEYHRQVKESEGFDITLDLTLGTHFGAPITPLRGTENDPIILDLSRKAIKDFNSQNYTAYEFVKIVTVNTSVAAGMWYYITFLATDADATTDDDSNASKTFQALAWWGIDGKTKVKFCRFKKPSD